MRVATADGRPYLATHSARYDAIFLDAFRQPYIPFYLTTQEFWRLAQERLNPGGMVMANVGTVPGSERLPAAIAGTMATVFPASTLARRRLQRDRGRLPRPVSPASCAPVWPRRRPRCSRRRSWRRLKPSRPSNDPLTDDRAPVEWLTDQLIVRYASGG